MIGKRATAPCGHEGEHVTANMVLCRFAWCDGKAPTTSKACPHRDLYIWSTYSSCKQCGRIVRP